MLRFKIVWLALLVLALFAAALRADDKARKATSKSGTVSAAVPSNDAVAALVNGEKIMLSELMGRLNELGVLPDKRELVAGDVLDALVDNVLLVQFLSAQKISYEAKAIDAQIAEVRAEYEKQGVKFADALAQLGITEQKLRGAVIAEAQWQQYLAKHVTDKQLAEYFAKYRVHFDGTEVRASHILIEVSEDASDAARAAARVKIEKVRKELAAGTGFAAAAKKYSDCPSKDQGGDVDWFPRRDKMVEPFAQAAFALPIGGSSDIVETEFGYHIIQVTAIRPGKRTDLKDPALRKEVLESLGEQLKDDIVERQRKLAKIEIAPGVEPPNQPKAKTAAQPAPNKLKK